MSYNTGSEIINLPERIGTLSLLIKSEGVGDFNVEVSQGGTGSEFCGDDICQFEETPENCPSDCAVANNVKFRTTDISYPSGTAVAYSSTCGNELIAYGKTSGACTDKLCENSDYDLLVPSSSGTVKFWVRDSENVCICDPGTTSGYSRRYSISDSDAGKVDTTFTGFDSAKEMAC